MYTTTYPSLHGLNCTHTESEQGDNEHVDRYEYTRGNRRVTIDVHHPALPSQWRIRQSATAYWYENGEQVGSAHSYNILENAQIKAVRFCFGLNNDSSAQRKLDEIEREQRATFRRQVNQLLEGRDCNRDELAGTARYAFNINLNDQDNAERIFEYINAYLNDPEAKKLAQTRDESDQLGKLIIREAREQHIPVENHPRYAEIMRLTDQLPKIRERVEKRIGEKLGMKPHKES